MLNLNSYKIPMDFIQFIRSSGRYLIKYSLGWEAMKKIVVY